MESLSFVQHNSGRMTDLMLNPQQGGLLQVLCWPPRLSMSTYGSMFCMKGYTYGFSTLHEKIRPFSSSYCELSTLVWPKQAQSSPASSVLVQSNFNQNIPLMLPLDSFQTRSRISGSAPHYHLDLNLAMNISSCTHQSPLVQQNTPLLIKMLRMIVYAVGSSGVKSDASQNSA
ncbi:hypothetical protein VNO77_33972 [Canavalia gladiata]|uniref:Uncharacterized protein n=1 Tax=Canavalia gladiata TaxID=3824 RepID=A0AAN9PWV8_CANGL